METESKTTTKASWREKLRHKGEKLLGHTLISGETGAEAIQAYEERMARLGVDPDYGVIIQFMIAQGERTYITDEQGRILIENFPAGIRALEKNRLFQMRTKFPDGTTYKLNIELT